jgi:hypothetical protein
MNFFGHAALALAHFELQRPVSSESALSRICAGAMLPDFVGMLRIRRPAVLDAELARGVSFHHLTDHLFHELTAFQHLSRSAFTWLSERGMPRGPARAVAHIGIEILLDEELARDERARESYRAALSLPLVSFLEFAGTDDGARLDSLQQALLGRAASERSPAPEIVAARIARTLAGRPRLATDPAGQALLVDWVAQSRREVSAQAPELLAILRAQLASSGGAE